MFLSCESLTCLLLSLHAVFSTMLEFLFLCDFAGAVAPDSFSVTVMTSCWLVRASLFIDLGFP